ncbi:MAG: hypothetical protein V4603_00155 [Pseudomonadota bacterium]
MSGFSIDWLNLREPADQRARDAAVREQALAWLGIGAAPGRSSINPGEAIVVDLGTGTGSTLRALSAPGSQLLVWRLVDNDGDLLDEALRRHGKHYRIEDYQSDLTVIGELPLGGARLITASALFDLVSANFVDTLVKRLKAMSGGWPVGLYAALNYDGTTSWNPPHPYDTAVLTAFNQDQCKDKGFGLALGPQAGSYLATALQQAGFTVTTASTPWQLGAEDSVMMEALVNGIAAAVANDYGLATDKLAEWRSFRLAHCQNGSCSVGHLDVLALPAS